MTSEAAATRSARHDSSQPSPSVALGMSLAFGSALFYAANTPLAKLGSLHGLPAQHLGLYRAAMLLAVVAIIMRMRGRMLVPPAGTRKLVFVLGAGSSCVALGYLGAVNFIPVGLAAIIFYTYPLAIMLLAPVIDGTRLSASRIGLAVLAFTGLAIAIGPGFTTLHWQGLALAGLASAGCTAMFFSGARLAARGLDTLAITVGAQTVSVSIMLVVLLLISEPFALPTQPIAWGILAGVAVIYSGAYLLNLRAVAAAPPAKIGIVYYVEPVLSALIAALLLAERLAVSQYVGGIIVIAALVWAGLLERRAARMGPERRA